MNKVVLIGRLTRDPEIRYYNQQDGTQMAIARYSLAVDRKGKDSGADFIGCVAFNKHGEFAEKYLRKGMKIGIIGRIQGGSYIKQDGQKVYTADVIVEEHEFCEKKADSKLESAPDDFVQVPEDAVNDLPFK